MAIKPLKDCIMTRSHSLLAFPLSTFLHLLHQAYQGLLVVLFIGLFLTAHNLSYGQSPSAGVNLDDVSSGELLLRGSAGVTRSALLKSTDVDASIHGLIARVVVKQKFENNSRDWVEGEYVFPLPTDSAVDYMAMIVGERRIVGKIHEKQQAKKIYQQAKQAGKKASLVEQQRPNLFRNRVANIAPGETVSIELRYVETLKYDQGRFSLRVPTTITPRYIPGQTLAHLQTHTHTHTQDEGPDASNAAFAIDRNSGWALPTDQVPDAHLITPPMTTADKAAPLQFSATVNAGLPLTEIKSVYHPAQVSENNRVYTLNLDSSSKLNKDVLLEWTPATGQAPAAALFYERKFYERKSYPKKSSEKTLPENQSHENIENSTGKFENYLLLMVLPPQQLAEANILPRETIFIIDTSGSMAGNSIRQAQQALLRSLSELKPRDRFNIIEFDSQARALWPQAQYADNNSVFQAERFVKGLVADGGTEMASALQLALGQDAPAGYVRQVIFITDGSVGNEDALFNFIENQRRNSRIFTVGIGSAPNSYFMQRAAEAGHGSYTYIGAMDDIEQRMADLFFKLENPVLTNIRVDFGRTPATDAIEVLPTSIPDLYAGEPLMLAVATGAALPVAVEITGERNQAPFSQTLPLNDAKNAQDVGKLWARKKIESLSQDLRRLPATGADATTTKAVEQEITQVALQHQLLSKFTSFVAVEEKISRPQTQTLRNKKVPNAMPEGNTMLGNAVSNNNVANNTVLNNGSTNQVAFGRTALGLNQLWLTGTIALLAFMIVFLTRFTASLRGHRA